MADVFGIWQSDARVALADRGVGYHRSNKLIKDAARYCAATGQNPYEAFGSAQDFAARTFMKLSEPIPVTVDRRGDTAAELLRRRALTITARGAGLCRRAARTGRPAVARMLLSALWVLAGARALAFWLGNGDSWLAILVAAPGVLLFGWEVVQLAWEYARHRRDGYDRPSVA